MHLTRLLREEMTDAWAALERAMDDVTDDMLHWEPAPGCWGLRRQGGRVVLDHDRPTPILPGPKTIAWLAAHLATCKEMYHEYAFGPGRRDWEDLQIPFDAEGLRRYLSEAHRVLVADLEAMGEDDLERPVATNWGEARPAWWIFWTMIYHDAAHGAQIMQIKNEYRSRRGR